MNIPSWSRRAALLLSLLVASACSDTPTAPQTSKPDASLEDASNHELLVQIMTKLNTLEARVNREALALSARVDSAIAAGVVVTGGPAGAASAGAEVGLEATACVSGEGGVKARLETKAEVNGEGEGKAGADVYGSGAGAKIRAMASQIARIMPGGELKYKIEVCGKLGGSAGVATAVRSAQFASGPASVRTGASPLQPILEGLLATVSQNKLAAAASAMQLDGSRLNAGIDALTTLTTGDFAFGQGAAARILAAVPLPPGISNFLSNPLSVLQQGPQALQFAIDRLCSQTFFTGELAQLGSQACSLRGNWPAPGTLINILQGLNGLPQTIGTIQSDLSGACGTISAMLPASVTIPSKTVTFPLGIGDVQVFPGFHKSLFTGVNSPC